MFENIEFANPKLLWLLLLAPLAIVWYVLRHKKQEASLQFSDLKGFAQLPKTWKAYLRHLLFAMKEGELRSIDEIAEQVLREVSLLLNA